MRSPDLASVLLDEDKIQCAVFQHIRQRGVPGLVAFHVRNEGKDQRDPKARIRNWKRGVHTGASDIILLYDHEFYALEVKADYGDPTPKQKEFLRDVEAAGGTAVYQRGLRACLHQLERWGLLRGRAA